MHKGIIQKEGYTGKNAHRLIRTMTLLVRSLESITLPELRAMLTKLAGEVINMVQEFVTYSGVRDASLQFFSRMIISLGADILGDVKKLLRIVLVNLDVSTFIQVVQMTNLIMQSLKETAVSFVDEMLPFLLNSAINMGLPAEAISDIQKTHMDAINILLKLVRAISTNKCAVFFKLSLEQFNSLITLLHNCSQSDIEDIRKNGASTMLHLLTSSLGLAINGDKVIAATKGATPEVGSEYAASLVKGALDCAFLPLRMLNAKNPTDMQCVQDIGTLHYLLYKTVHEQFMAKLLVWSTDNTYIESMKQGLENASSTETTKQYKELLKQIIGKINKQ